MKIRRALRQPFEWFLTALGCVVIPWLPRWAVVCLAHGLGAVGFCLSAGQRHVALANVRVALGDGVTDEQAYAIVRQSFQSFALTVLDLFWFSVFVRRRLQRYVRFDQSVEPVLETRPCIFLTAHFGNWEVLGRAMGVRGRPTSSVASPLKNRMVDRLVNVARRMTGQRIATKQGAMRSLLTALKRGEDVALLIDQNIRPDLGGAFVTLFGLPAPITQAPAALARHTGAPLVFASCTADGRGGYAVRMRKIAVAESQSDAEATQMTAAQLERAIRQMPGQWLWMYKRWKTIPEGADPERFPFYAAKHRAVPEAKKRRDVRSSGS